MRSRPPVFPNLKGGEIALLTVEALQALEPPVSLHEMVASLVGRGGVAVAVVGEANAAAIAEADRHGLALIEVPEGYPLPDLEGATNRAITDRRTELYQRGIELQQRLFDLAAGGRGLATIVGTLADLTGHSAALIDEAMGLRVLRPPGRSPGEEAEVLAVLPGLIEELRVRLAVSPPGVTAGRSPIELQHADGRWRALVAPVPVGPHIRGHLLLFATEAWSAADRLTATQGASACALDLAREWAIVEAESRVRGEFLADLLITGQATEEQILTRARHLGYDLSQPLQVVALAPDPEPAIAHAGRLPLAEADLVAAIQAIADKWMARAPVGAISGAVVVLWPVDKAGQETATLRRAEVARVELANRVGIPCSVGIGRFRPGIPGIRRSWVEARQALVIAQSMLGGNRTASFAELGAFRVLFQLFGNAEAAGYCEEVLGTLDRYDNKHRSELIRTLEAFIQCNGSLVQAAELLAVHRNTLAYRLRRIEELTDRDLASFEDLFELELALKLRKALS